MASQLEEFIESADNLPLELRHHFLETKYMDERMAELRKGIGKDEKAILAGITPAASTSATGNDEKKAALYAKYADALDLADEKIKRIHTAMDLLVKHTMHLDELMFVAAHEVEDADTIYGTPALDHTARSSSRKSTGRNRPPASSSRRARSGIAPDSLLSDDFDDAAMVDAEDDQDQQDDQADREPLYCVCQQVSFGEMIACDNAEKCPYEWFHYGCVGLSAPPQGTWYCPVCAPKMKKR